MTTLMIYILLIIAVPFALLGFSRKRTKRLPPGPRGLSLLTNLLGFAQDKAGDTDAFLKWSEDYGSIMHIGALGNHMIILNTAKAASDLMDKRANTYSHRPRMVMLNELVGNGWQLGLATGEPHKEQRSLAQRYFLTQIKDWQIIQLESARTLLGNLIAHHDDWAAFVRMSVASSVLEICYGHKITHPDDHLLTIAMDALNCLGNAPYLADAIPLLKYYPSWLPGGGFHRDAIEARVSNERLRHIPFNMVRSQMAAGIASPSFIAALLNPLTPDENLEHLHQAGLIRDAAAGIYLAAMDSTVSSMYTFIGLMVLHPEIQRRAQSELDSVLSQDRLPTFEDRSSLPFIECIVLEVLRYNVVTPLGVPHKVTTEDRYLGYQIPKGSTILGNIWAILRDPDVFPSPEQFDPSRFLATTRGSAKAREVLESAVFGWGRRACPGRHVGQSTLFISFSHILTCLDITKPVDDNGNQYEPSLKFLHSQFVRRALPIPCTIKLRSDKIARLLAHPE